MNPLISVDELVAIVDEPDTRIADVRWYLGEPERGRAAYLDGHVPGAVHIDLETHLSAPEGPGRHPLPSRESFARTIGGLGFGTDHRIVAYDDRGGVIAARLWWMLRDIGHDRVQVLDGGLQAWEAAGHRSVAGSVELEPTAMSVRASTTRQLDRGALAGRLGSVVILDARAGDRYRGETEPIDPVAGHIPTARNAPTDENLDSEGRLLDPMTLAERYRSLGTEGSDVVVYCGSGVTACHDILAMRVAGLPEAILYPGSWSDWSSSGGEVVRS